MADQDDKAKYPNIAHIENPKKLLSGDPCPKDLSETLRQLEQDRKNAKIYAVGQINSRKTTSARSKPDRKKR